MRPALKALFFLCLFVEVWVVDAGGRGQPTKGHGRKHESFGRDSRHSYFYYDHDRHRERRESSHSRRRRRRKSRSESRTPDKRKSSDKLPKNSPGYEEYKRQKQEAAAWQERRLQAEALAMCLEEREQLKQAAVAAGVPKAPPGQTGHDTSTAQGSAVPKLPSKHTTQVQDPPKESSLADVKIPVVSLKLLEAELGHAVDLGQSPLSAKSLEALIVQPKRGLGKKLDQFISRYGKDAPPARVAAKAKMVAAILGNLQF